ncbi:serine--tRNA ligase [Candidatus Uabimicrobium sp. HlEnr_7]|uniref:serine--tRNA ligase n=1 Tax=Candidatus Uabimicrobium helgolandensis TaxID=3095367 RepID=UPI003558CC77
MLDIKFVRKYPDKARELLKKRKYDHRIDDLLQLDELRREKIVAVENLKQIRNQKNEEVAAAKKEGRDISEVISHMKETSKSIKDHDHEISEIDDKIRGILLEIPNLPQEDIPIGDESQNKLLSVHGEKSKFDFTPKAHWDLGKDLGILETERASRMSGSGFNVLVGAGARFERALINFMLDLQVEAGYTEISPPHLVLRRTVEGSGQLPKMENDMYNTQPDDLFLIPTSEVALVNLYQNEVIPASEIPISVTAATSCYRREAGAAGKDTRGLLRVHEFKKVELVKFVEPNKSDEALETILKNAEAVLQKLNLHYRVLLLASEDMSFASSKTYDLEVWAPGVERWLEVSSCSNCKDFQARRANIRYKNQGEKPQFLHLLNGSGLAVPRLMAAIWETYQKADGRISVPEALQSYLSGAKEI